MNVSWSHISNAVNTGYGAFGRPKKGSPEMKLRMGYLRYIKDHGIKGAHKTAASKAKNRRGYLATLKNISWKPVKKGSAAAKRRMMVVRSLRGGDLGAIASALGPVFMNMLKQIAAKAGTTVMSIVSDPEKLMRIVGTVAPGILGSIRKIIKKIKNKKTTNRDVSTLKKRKLITASL